MTTPLAVRNKFLKLVEQGETMAGAARLCRISENTATSIQRKYGNPHRSGLEIRRDRTSAEAPDPLHREQLKPRALLALDDFATFQRTYLGRIPVPWQVEGAGDVQALLKKGKETGDKQYVVINAPQGSGKSTLFTCDIPLHLTVQNRAIRGLIVSATATKAKMYLGRLRRILSATMPVKGEAEDLAKGLALDAEATLSEDFGRFKPLEHTEVWARDAIVVEQLDGRSITEKEPTWSVAGRDTDFLGGRYDVVLCDDLVDPDRLRSQEQVERDQTWFVDVCESRLEPGGLLVLQGQRLGANDLYRYALDMRAPVEVDDTELTDEELADFEAGAKPKYQHIKFMAHYDDRCRGKETHRRGAVAYPEGCLLYPDRLPWRELSAKMMNRLDRFRVVYQQEDADPEGVLVNPEWIRGGNGYPGCWDMDRDRLELPSGIDRSKLISVMTCDPSPTRYWSIQWWAVDPDSEQRFLMDHIRRGMDASDFLDFNLNTRKFTGILDEWLATSTALSIPITHVIVETNAAQRFLLQYDFVHKWMALRGVRIIPHETHRNKSDPNFGIQTIAGAYQFGRVRLPGKPQSMGRVLAIKLTDEVTRWPHASTDDCVMAHWFLEFHLPALLRRERRQSEELRTAARPAWMADEYRGIAGEAGASLGGGRVPSRLARMMALASSTDEESA